MTSCVATITGPGEGLARVEAMLDEMARAHRLDADPVADMHVALDEVLSNIFRHGFADGLPHRVEVRLSVGPAMLKAEVEDDCAPFDPLSLPPPDLSGSVEDRPIGGLGVFFVMKLMSAVRYVRDGARNRLVLEKSLPEIEGRTNGTA
jgi:anti-sigma regulatory factor (Ser/Thr protein kinase)